MEKFLNGNKVSLAKAYQMASRYCGMNIGDNMTCQVVHAVTQHNSQATFDSKHLINSQSSKRHYDRPIKILKLNKNKDKDILIVFDDGSFETCTLSDIKSLWTNKSMLDIYKKTILYIEEIRAFKRDLFGIHFYINIIDTLFPSNINPWFLIFIQAFNSVKDSILTMTRNNGEHLRDFYSASTFEDFKKNVEKFINKNSDPLLESNTRDSFGLLEKDFFDLIYESGTITQDKSGVYTRVVGNAGTKNSKIETTPKKSASRSKRNCNSSFISFIPKGYSKRVYTNTRNLPIFVRENGLSFRASGIKCQSIYNANRILNNVFNEKCNSKNHVYSSLNDVKSIKRIYPIKLFNRPKFMKLKNLTKQSKHVKSLKNVFHIEEFKKLILKNVSNRMLKSIMNPSHGELKWVPKKMFMPNCSVCDFKNKHKTRRKQWKCPKCKTIYYTTCIKNLNSNKIKKLFNENALIYNSSGYWTVIPSPIRFAHSPRLMYDGLKRYFKDLENHNFPKNTTPTINSLNALKKKIFYPKPVPSWYMYPHEIPVIYGSVLDQIKGGKENIFRKKIATKRCDRSCRMTVTCDASLNHDEISIPKDVWIKMGKPQKTLFIRFPSVWRRNLSLLSVNVYDEEYTNHAMCIRVNPSICEGQNMDFDGDAGTLKAIDKNCEYEITTLLSPVYSYAIDGNKPRITFSSDAKLGLGFTEINGQSVPMHKLASSFIFWNFVIYGNSKKCFEMFSEISKIGYENSFEKFNLMDRESIFSYIKSDVSKLSFAHYHVMFLDKFCLENGLNFEQFIEKGISTRQILLNTPTHASDDGVVFSTLKMLTFDAYLHYDYTLRTTKNEFITCFPFQSNPYPLEPIPFSVEDDDINQNDFKPFLKFLKLEKVNLSTNNLNLVFKNIVNSKMFTVYIVKFPKKCNFKGNLIYTNAMKNLGLKLNVNYMVKFKFQESPFFFKFIKIK